ncbi:DNA-3-methyladenine glycosylase 2 family protein [Candidatus Woesearchaeota archaeon]|nr:DNA-3-methyladenine glycosylase 2 family protein [Candidatus Woesearchaeota archaeon]
MNSIILNDFSLQHTLESGQFFRYTKDNDGYRIITKAQSFFIKQKDQQLLFDTNVDFVKELFSLNEDFNSIKNHLIKDKLISKAVNKYTGLRLMKQDPWECLIAFICSSASNIPKIKKNIDLLSQKFGKETQEKGFYYFPKQGKINDLKTIRACATGFRAEYIFNANQIVNNSFLNKLGKLSYEDAKKELMQLKGVGEKIADCVLLFAYGKQEAFPVDIWIKRVIEKHYLGHKASTKLIQQFGQKKFAPYAGYTQQYLYHWERLQN